LNASSSFPFLIGTVRTDFRIDYWEYYNEFPFLIGTVRTESEHIFYIIFVSVSIPHRYGKNR